MLTLTIRPVTPADLERCFVIESACYGPEAAPRQRIEKRIATYPEGFLVAELDGQIIGFANSGATSKEDISDAALKDMVGHEPDGRNIVIFSLAVAPEYQGRGYSRVLMRAFIETARQLGKANILLMCKAKLVPYYQSYGFMHLGESLSAYAGMRWQEMVLRLGVEGT